MRGVAGYLRHPDLISLNDIMIEQTRPWDNIKMGLIEVPSTIPLTLLIAIALPAFYVLRAIHQYFTSPLRKLPSPPLTTLTSLHLPLLAFFSPLTPLLSHWHSTYGPVIRFSPNRLSFLSRKAVKDIYQDPHVEKDTSLYGLFTHFGAHNAFSTTTAQEHGWRRKGVAERYTLSRVLKVENEGEGVRRVVKAFCTFVEKGTKGGEGWDVDLYLANIYYAVDNVTKFLFGNSGFSDALGAGSDEEGSRKTKEIRDIIWAHYSQTKRARVDLYVILKPVMVIFDGLLLRIRALLGLEVDKDWEGISRMRNWGISRFRDVRARIKIASEDEDCVVSRLARLVDESRDGWTEETAASEILDHMLAGMDTTSDTLSFLFYRLSLPESVGVQEDFQKSLEKLIPCGTIPHSNRQFLADLLAHPYLDAILSETFRLYPAIPLYLPRVVVQPGKIIDGIPVPPGTVVGSFAAGIHADISVYGDDVNDFRPGRWLEATTEKRKEMESRLWVFGSGSRGCVGRHLAMLEMKFLIAVVYSRYTTRTVKDEETEVTVQHK